MKADIQAFADQYGVDASTVIFITDHVVSNMTAEVILAANTHEELTELIRAGVQSALEAHKRLAVRAHMEPRKQSETVYSILAARNALPQQTLK